MGEHFKPGRLFVYSFIRGEPGRLSESFFVAKRRETTENIYILCIYIFSSLLVSFCRKRRKKNRNFSLSFFPRRSNLLRSWCKVSLTLGHVSCLGWSSYSPFLGWSKYSPFGLEYIFTFMGWSINIRLFSVSFQRRRTSSGSRLESLKESSPRSRRRFFPHRENGGREPGPPRRVRAPARESEEPA